jgi:ABC-type nitrate/sulfonate/bicarbonate transport system permease component
MDDKQKIKYHEKMRNYYDNDEIRLAQAKADRREAMSESMGYYAGKIISGYFIGSIFGAILAFWFIWYFIVEPWVIPIVKIFLDW